MKLLEVYDWALRGIIETMQKEHITDEERKALDQKLKEVAALFVKEKNNY